MTIMTGKEYAHKYGHLPEDRLPTVRQVGFFQGRQHIGSEPFHLHYIPSTQTHGHWMVSDSSGKPAHMIISGNALLAVEE